MLSYHGFQRTSSSKESMTISKIRCQKEKINTQVKVSDQGQLLKSVVLQAENRRSPFKSGGEPDRVNPD